MSESDHLTGLTSHAVAMLGNCQAIVGQLERGEKLTRHDVYTLAKCREYIRHFMAQEIPSAADIDEYGAAYVAAWAQDEADR